MLTVTAALVYFLSSAACAHRIRFARNAFQCLVFVPFVVGAWVTLLTTRTPTPISMTLNFLFVDMTILLLAVTGIFRMLGGFDPPPPAGLTGEAPPTIDLPNTVEQTKGAR